MRYMAIVSFSGVLTMAAGEVRSIPDPAVAADLLKAGYITTVPDRIEQEPDPEPAMKKKGRTRKS